MIRSHSFYSLPHVEPAIFCHIMLYMIKIEKNRHMILLNCLLHTRISMTSDQLAEMVHVSSRTIKNDIAELNDRLLAEDIAEIVSEQAKGYHIVPRSVDRYIAFRTMIQNLITFYAGRPVETTNRMIFIIQKILSNAYVRMDDLAEYLHLSKASLVEDIMTAQNFLKSYALHIRSIPGKGIRIEGNEYDIRQCMVEANIMQYRDARNIYDVPEFVDQFYQHRKDYEDIRHAMLEQLRKSKISLTDIGTKRCATYITLLPHRHQQNKKIIFSSSIRKELMASEEYAVAKCILRLPEVCRYVTIDEEDSIDFARLLILFRDFDLRNEQDVKSVKPLYLVEAGDLLERSFHHVRTSMAQSFYASPLFVKYRNDFASLVLHIYLENRFGHTASSHLITYAEALPDRISPICMEMAREFIDAIGTELNEKEIDGAVIISFGALFQCIMRKIPYAYHPRRIAVVSTAGKVIAEQIRESLLDHFGRYISNIDIFEQYEMRKTSFSNYDAAISTSFSHSDNYYPMPFIQDIDFEAIHQNEALFHDLFLPGFVSRALNHLKEITHCYDDFQAEDLPSAIRILAFRYCHFKNVKEVSARMMRFERIHSYFSACSSTAFLFFTYEEVGQEMIDVYHLKSVITHANDTELKYIMVICLAGKMPVEDLCLIERMMQLLQKSSEWVNDLFKSSDDAWDRAFEAVVGCKFRQNHSARFLL